MAFNFKQGWAGIQYWIVASILFIKLSLLSKALFTRWCNYKFVLRGAAGGVIYPLLIYWMELYKYLSQNEFKTSLKIILLNLW